MGYWFTVSYHYVYSKCRLSSGSHMCGATLRQKVLVAWQRLISAYKIISATISLEP